MQQACVKVCVKCVTPVDTGDPAAYFESELTDFYVQLVRRARCLALRVSGDEVIFVALAIVIANHLASCRNTGSHIATHNHQANLQRTFEPLASLYRSLDALRRNTAGTVY